jgi:hypothetical protein
MKNKHRLDQLSEKTTNRMPQTAEQLGVQAFRNQVSVQDRMHFVLDPGAVPDDLIASGHEAPQTFGIGLR